MKKILGLMIVTSVVMVSRNLLADTEWIDAPYWAAAEAGYYKGPSFSFTSGFQGKYLFGEERNAFANAALEIEGGYTVTDWYNGSNTTYTGPFNQVTEPQKSGGIIDAGVNAVQLVGNRTGLWRLFVFGGPRFAYYDVTFRYPAFTDNVDVFASSWGLGGGLRLAAAAGPHLDAILQVGLDYYFPTTEHLDAHGSYPFELNVDARNNDALARADVPRLRPRVMVGFQFF